MRKRTLINNNDLPGHEEGPSRNNTLPPKLARYALASVLAVSAVNVPGNNLFAQGVPRYPGYENSLVANDAAQLANTVYELKTPPGDRYEITPKTGADGFQAAAYKDRWTGRTYVVYAGTQLTDPGDLRADRDIGNLQLNMAPADAALDSQIRQARSFYKEVTQGVPNGRVVVVGHSLGGYLAQIVGADNQVTTHTYNAPGVPDTALERYGIEIRTSLDMVNHVRATDPAGAFGNHLGQTVTYRDAREPIGINGAYRPAGLIDNHSIVPFSSDLPEMEGVITTNQEVEKQRAERTQDTGYVEGRNDWINPDAQVPEEYSMSASTSTDPRSKVDLEAPRDSMTNQQPSEPGPVTDTVETRETDSQQSSNDSAEGNAQPMEPAREEDRSAPGAGHEGLADARQEPVAEARRGKKLGGGWEEVFPSEDSGAGWTEIVPDDNLEGSGWVEIKGDPNYEETAQDRKNSDPLDDYLKSLDTSSADGQVAAYLEGLDPEAARLWGQLQQEWARIDREEQGRRKEAVKAFQPAISSFTNGFMASQANAFTKGSGLNLGQCSQLSQQIRANRQWLNKVVPNRSQYDSSMAVDAAISQARRGLDENMRQFRAGGC